MPSSVITIGKRFSLNISCNKEDTCSAACGLWPVGQPTVDCGWTLLCILSISGPPSICWAHVTVGKRGEQESKYELERGRGGSDLHKGRNR